MKKYVFIALLTCIFLGCSARLSFASFKSTKFTIVVVDEEDRPLSGIRVGVGFERNVTWGTKSSGQHGVTDADGKLTFSGESNGHITYGGRMDGYYPSYYDYDFKGHGAFGWEPWDPELKVVMRKIENPVAMYAKDTKRPSNGILIPEIEKDLGFDLIEYDWLPPYGKGKSADFIFYLESMFLGNRNYNFTIKVKTTEGNGFIKIIENLENGSEFKLPRLAPVDGYVENLDLFARWNPGSFFETSKDKNNNYIFRVRSKIDDGKVESAMYGKILRDFEVHPQPNGLAKISFLYYLNPDGSRNLEFDSNGNLFKNLSPMERIGIK